MKRDVVSQPKLLVVDDDLVALELIAETLQSLGARAKCVQSSRKAVELIKEEKFYGFFLDWMMPEIDGLEVARQIRKSRPNHKAPIVMLTANTEPEAMERAFEAGVNVFLTKPVTPQKVKKLLNASRGMILAERRRYQRVSVSLDVLCAWNGQRIRGIALNLSPSGILLRTEKLPPEGADITLAFELPGAARRLELVGRVVRVAEGTGVGVKFTESRPVDRKLLAGFVDKMAGSLPPELVF